MKRLIRRALVPLLGLVLVGIDNAGAQVVARNGYEAFAGVEYKGGDTRFPKKAVGVLVLTDSTIAFHHCFWSNCSDRKGTLFDPNDPVWRVSLVRIREVSSRTENLGTSTGSKVLWGAFAGDRNEELFAFSHETESSAEAPVFKTPRALAGAIEAKVRFRLKKLGVTIDQ